MFQTSGSIVFTMITLTDLPILFMIANDSLGAKVFQIIVSYFEVLRHTCLVLILHLGFCEHGEL